MTEVKKAIIPIAGLSTRFLPLSKSVPKELWPLVDKPVIQYIVEEVKKSGISQIIFVISPKKKAILDYFKKSREIEKILKDRKKDQILAELKHLEDISQDISFSVALQKKQLGDGHAVLQAEKFMNQEPFAVLFGDDIVDSSSPCLLQLLNIFKTSQKPVVALARVSKEKIPLYGIVEVEKIAKRIFKIKKIVEKPTLESAPSDLAVVGKYVLTPEIFPYLKKVKIAQRGEIGMADALAEMIKSGIIIYGYEFEGKWLECGNKLGWLRSHLHLSLKHQQFGPELKEYLK